MQHDLDELFEKISKKRTFDFLVVFFLLLPELTGIAFFQMNVVIIYKTSTFKGGEASDHVED
jgi:hypothetical protein